MSLRDDILAVKFNKVSGPVKVSAWGRDVHVRTLSVGEVRQCLAATDPDICSVVLGVCDPDGNRVFSDDDITAVASMPVGVIGPIAKAIAAHNRLSDGDDAKNG